jgi:hypothetical protein
VWLFVVSHVRDVDEIFARLAKSPFRRRFRLGAKERGYLAAKGLRTILDHAREFIDQRLAPANPRKAAGSMSRSGST